MHVRTLSCASSYLQASLYVWCCIVSDNDVVCFTSGIQWQASGLILPPLQQSILCESGIKACLISLIYIRAWCYTDTVSHCSIYSVLSVQDNEYVQAIKSVASVLAPYDSDQLIPAFGFGARIPPDGEVSHCFPLTFNNDNPDVYGVQVCVSVCVKCVWLYCAYY